MEFDLVIVGAGPIGASLAVALGGLSLRIGVVEAHAAEIERPSFDDRSLALALGSRRILETLDLWRQLEATPIDTVHISDAGLPGVSRLRKQDQGVPALGYVVAARTLRQALAARLAGLSTVQLFCPATVRSVTLDRDGARLIVGDGVSGRRELSARLLVAADGADSTVRQILGVPARVRDYRQSAIIANLTSELPHRNVAYERFTNAGPLALLPLGSDRFALVCTAPTDQCATLLGLDDETFLGVVQKRFGDRVGRFQRLGRRTAFPLKLVTARPHRLPRVVLIGNAAHSLHPVAGQGFNLGLRDVAALADVIAEALVRAGDPGAVEVLQRYTEWRRGDQRRATVFTDALVRLFSSNLPPLRLARGAGLLAFDLLPPLKQLLAQQAMGMAGRLPRLARGLPLTAGRGNG